MNDDDVLSAVTRTGFGIDRIEERIIQDSKEILGKTLDSKGAAVIRSRSPPKRRTEVGTEVADGR